MRTREAGFGGVPCTCTNAAERVHVHEAEHSQEDGRDDLLRADTDVLRRCEGVLRGQVKDAPVNLGVHARSTATG